MSAEQGDEIAKNNLGLLYLNGLGVKENYTLAFYWFQKSAEEKYAEAQGNLGLMYLFGLGVPESKKDAASWIDLARKAGHAASEEYWNEYKLWKY
jgi:TPR repeat protein